MMATESPSSMPRSRSPSDRPVTQSHISRYVRLVQAASSLPSARWDFVSFQRSASRSALRSTDRWMRSTTLRDWSSDAIVSGSISGVCMTRPAPGASAGASAEADGALVVVVIGLVSCGWLGACSSLAAHAVEQALRHDEPMDLVRPLVDLRALGVAHEALDRVVAR